MEFLGMVQPKNNLVASRGFCDRLDGDKRFRLMEESASVPWETAAEDSKDAKWLY